MWIAAWRCACPRGSCFRRWPAEQAVRTRPFPIASIEDNSMEKPELIESASPNVVASPIATMVKGKGADIAPLSSEVREFIRASKAENTLRGYQSDWREFW